MDIPIIGIAGFSGSGKTTLIEKLIPCIRSRGLRTAVVKHDGHWFEIDHEGKDSYRFAHAGAEQVILTSGSKTVCIEQRGSTLEDSLHYVHDVDLVLVEGYKAADITQIGICRTANGKGLTAEPEHFLAVVTDREMPNCPVPVFGLDDTEKLTDYLISHRGRFTAFTPSVRS